MTPPESAPVAPPGRSAARRRGLVVAGLVLAALVLLFGWRRFVALPPDASPEGAYLRIGAALDQDDIRAVYAHLDDETARACVALRDARRRASERVAATYPEPERTRLLDAYRAEARASEGADVWIELARRGGFAARLRADMSGISHVSSDPAAGESANRRIIETARGTRYGFVPRAEGGYGLDLFRAEIAAEAERATRDAEVIDQASKDYARGAAPRAR